MSSAAYPSEYVTEKARRLADAGRVTLTGMDTATVQGDTGRYTVRAHMRCPCASRRSPCSHSLAAILAWADAINEGSES